MYELYIRELEEEIKDIDNRLSRCNRINNSLSQEIRRLESLKEEKILRLEKAKNDFDLNKVEQVIDDHYEDKKNKNLDKQEEVTEKIDNLNNQYYSTRTKLGKRIVGKRLERQNDKLKRLKSKNVRLVGRQRFFMMPKELFRRFVDYVRAYTLGREKYTVDKINDLELLQDSLGDNLFSRIASSFIDRGIKYYEAKDDAYKSLVGLLQMNNVIFKGGRSRPINNELLRKLAENRTKAFDFANKSNETTHEDSVEVDNLEEAKVEEKPLENLDENERVIEEDNKNSQEVSDIISEKLGKDVETDEVTTMTNELFEDYNGKQVEKLEEMEPNDKKARLEEMLNDPENIARLEEISKRTL